MKFQFDIYEGNMERLEKKLKSLKKKADKYQIPFNFNIIKEQFVSLWFNSDKDEWYKTETLYCIKKTFKVSTIEIDAEQVKLNDWIFIATLEHKASGNVVRKIENLEIPEKYFNSTSICEHCGTNRIRKDTYIVYNTITEEFKQVGKSCLKDFMGYKTAEQIAKFYQDLEQEVIIGNDTSSNGKNYYSKEDVLNIAIQVVDKYGYINSEKAREDCVISTKHRVMDYLNHDKHQLREYEIDYNINEERQNKINELVNWVNNNNFDSEYIRNLKVIIVSEYIEWRDIAILISVIPSHFKAMETLEEKERRERLKKEREQNTRDEYFGEIGKRYDLTLTVEYHILTESDFGTVKIYKMFDKEGKSFTWFTGTHLEDGKTYTMKATIKDHNEYKNKKQTIITRGTKIKEV